jgi:acyl-coenzyme A synthetase/AMP-(fatty) acid ligase
MSQKPSRTPARSDPQMNRAVARRHPDKPYVVSVDHGRTITFAALLRSGARLGADDPARDLLRFYAAQLPPFKTPKQIVLCAALSKSERGKLDRKALI